jgi:hypothetical protein
MLVSQDRAGIHQAALELFEEARLHGRDVVEEFRARGAAAFDDVEPEESQRTLPDGYYSWVGYLLYLESLLELGLQFSPRELEAADAIGLLVLKTARAEWSREHPACDDCGRPQETRFATHCPYCGAKFAREAA